MSTYQHVSKVMSALLARLNRPLEITDNKDLTSCTMSDKVCSKAGVQEQERLLDLYDAMIQKEESHV